MSLLESADAIRHQRVRARHINPSSPGALLATVSDLASLGQKRVGTPAGARAGAYLLDRMRGAGLDDVHYEEFGFPRHDVLSASLALRLEGWASDWRPGFDVFEGAGAGLVEGELVFAGTATDEELDRVSVRGAVALIERNRFFHRSSQYANLVAQGALAMIDVSAAPANLRQVGSIRRGFEAAGPIPALTVGADDGERLLGHLRGGRRVRAEIGLGALSTPATGANVVGRVAGREHGQIVIGAHYDTWFAGATDNGGGVAAMLALAESWAAREAPRYTLVFVAWDGEEIALYGGYDYLRRHRVLDEDPILAVMNLETPSALGGGFHGLARSGCPCLDHALRTGGLDRLYTGYLPMSAVPQIFGGVIPTDIQGWHRSGVPVASTAVDAPYYHTSADTPDKLDPDMLARVVDAFDRAIESLMARPPGAHAPNLDPDMWRATVDISVRRATVTVVDAAGRPQAGVPVDVSLLHDDFFLTAERHARTDESGMAQLDFANAEWLRGRDRWLHVGAGPKYPLAETLTPLV